MGDTYYEDEGCSHLDERGLPLYPSCLDCPLAVCLEEDLHKKTKTKNLLYAEVRKLHSLGWGRKAISDTLNIVDRTISRALKGH